MLPFPVGKRRASVSPPECQCKRLLRLVIRLAGYLHDRLVRLHQLSGRLRQSPLHDIAVNGTAGFLSKNPVQIKTGIPRMCFQCFQAQIFPGSHVFLNRLQNVLYDSVFSIHLLPHLQLCSNAKPSSSWEIRSLFSHYNRLSSLCLNKK